MHKILFAHPDPKLTRLYEHHLAPHFSFDSAADGLSALRKIKLISPSLVISEYHLPRISGPALLRFLRSQPQHQRLPFLFLTDHLDASEALSLGANDWLVTRTTQPDELIGKIYQHLKHNRVYLN